MSKAIISLIVAMTPDRVIGRDGKLPWHIPEDLQHFKKVTMGHPVVMGRKTYDSIGKPLPGRHNVVVTRNPGWRAEGVTAVTSLEQAFAGATTSSPRGSGSSRDPSKTPPHKDEDTEIFIIGGAQLYRAALPHASGLYVTLVHADIAGDTFFPEIDWTHWRLIERTARQRSKKHLDYTILRYACR